MPRNPFWTPSLAASTVALSSWQNPDGNLVFTNTDADPDLEASLGGQLTSFEVTDFITTNLVVGTEYLVLAVGDYWPSLAIYDNQGYLLLYTDGDDIGLTDSFRSDSIVLFHPDYTGTYYLSLSWEFVPGASGFYGIGGATVGGPPGGGGGGDDVGDTIATATSITTPLNKNSSVGVGSDEADVFKFVAPNTGILTARLTGLSDDIDLVLLDAFGNPLDFSLNAGTQNEGFSTLLAGGQTYYIGIFPYLSAHSNYSLSLEFSSAIGGGPSASTAAVSTVGSSGDAETNALIGGTKWGGPTGTGLTLTYSFPSSGSAYSNAVYSFTGEPFDDFAPLTDGQKAAVRSALSLWSDVANITFVEVPENGASIGDLRFAFSGGVDPTAAAHAYFPNASAKGGDVWISLSHYNASWVPGSYEFLTLIHEIGHTLGLKHPFDGRGGTGAVLPSNLDSTAFTVMAYADIGGSPGAIALFDPTTPMGLDVDAIQYLYGPNNATRNGDTVYAFAAGQSYYQTIWDADGIDTITYASQGDGAVIDLAGNSWCRLGEPIHFMGGPDREDDVFIPASVVIENAAGGEGPDHISGNAAGNTLVGNGGADTIEGGSGNDTLTGGGGNDSLAGGPGTDVVMFGAAQSAYQVRPLVGVGYRITGPDGVDNVMDVELIAFGGAAPLSIAAAVTPEIPIVSIGPNSAGEGNSGNVNLIFTISLSVAYPQPVTVTVGTANGSATGGGDFVPTNAVVTIPAGQISALFTVPIIGDSVIEASEIFSVNLSNPVNGILGAQSSTTGTILDDDFGSVSIAGGSVTEGNSGTTNVAFALTLSSISATDTVVHYATGNGSAQAGSDFTGVGNGAVTIAAGSATATVNVPVIGDTVIEPNETFTVTLTGTSNPAITVNPAGATATMTIVNDDAVALASVNDVSATEGSTAIFTVSLSVPPNAPVVVSYATANGTASAGIDFGATAGSLTFNPAGPLSQTVSVATIDDSIVEGPETFLINLTSVSGGAVGDGQGVATIVDNDFVPIVVAISSAVALESDPAGIQFLVSLSAASSQPVSVTATTSNGSALAGSDFAATSPVVTIPAGATSAFLSIPLLDDGIFEGNETFAVQLSMPGGGATISPTMGNAVGTIVNDDPGGSVVINGLTIDGTAADDFLVGGLGNDSINGGAGNNTLIADDGSDRIIAGPGGDFIVADDYLMTGNDFVDAGGGTNFVFAGGGNDTLLGGSSNDLLAGELGNDLIRGGDGDNALYGGDGNDTIQGGNGGDIVFGMFGDDVIVTQGGIDLVIEEPANTGGDDYIDVGSGGSQVFAGGGDDTVMAGSGTDFILGESGADRLVGGQGDDALIAGPGNDTVFGGPGNDILIPEGGDDSIAGGAGADVFRYPAGIAVNNDRIGDFTPADDAVELAASLGFATGAAALAAVAQVGADAVLTLTGGSITFVGVQVAALTVGDFVIV